MYAVVKTGGKQYRVSPGEKLKVEQITADVGAEVVLDEVLMVGDGFKSDVQAPNAVEIFAVWFNPRSEETRKSHLHITVHSTSELLSFFNSLD
jgi:ribosomal protein L21